MAQPDFRAVEGLAVWRNTDKNGNEYLTISLPLLGQTINAFPVKEE